MNFFYPKMLSIVDGTDEMKEQTEKLPKACARNMAIDHTLYHELFFSFLLRFFFVCPADNVGVYRGQPIKANPINYCLQMGKVHTICMATI